MAAYINPTGYFKKLRRQQTLSRKIERLAAWLGGLFDSFFSTPSAKPTSGFRLFLGRWVRSHALLYKFLLEVRSFLGHIEMSFGRSLWQGVLDLGPDAEFLPCGCLVPNAQTDFHILCIRKQEAAFPWATLADNQILFQTLDSGLDRRSRTSCSTHHKLEIPLNSQLSNSFSSQICSKTPAAIAGVTLRLECTRQKL